MIKMRKMIKDAAKGFCLAAGLVLFLATGVGAEKIKESPEMLFMKARQMELQEADYEGAIKVYDEIIKEYERKAEVVAQALYRTGLCYEKIGQTDRAEQLYYKIALEFAEQLDKMEEEQYIKGKITKFEPGYNRTEAAAGPEEELTFPVYSTKLVYAEDENKIRKNWNIPSSLRFKKDLESRLVSVPEKQLDRRLYGLLYLGDGPDKEVSVVMDIDLSDREDTQEDVSYVKKYIIYIDANRNRNLTDDGQISGPGVYPHLLKVHYSDGTREDYNIYQYLYKWPEGIFEEEKGQDYRVRDSLGYQLSYYAVSFREGEIAIGADNYKIALLDGDNDGIFLNRDWHQRPYEDKDVFESVDDKIGLDLNLDGTVDCSDSSKELFAAAASFELNGLFYRILAVSPGGAEITLVPAEIIFLYGQVLTQDGSVLPGAKIWVEVNNIKKPYFVDKEAKYFIPTTARATLACQATGYIPSWYKGIPVGDTAEFGRKVKMDFCLEKAQPIPFKGEVTLASEHMDGAKSYHFLEGKFYPGNACIGGDFYYGRKLFYANNAGQRGLMDLGQVNQPLEEIIPPADGGEINEPRPDVPARRYYRFGVPAQKGHTYVSLARELEEGYYIIFKVLELNDDSVRLEYLYTP